MKVPTLIALTLISSVSSAASYRSFNELSYEKIDNSNVKALRSTYHFVNKNNIGSYDEFGYFHTNSHAYIELANSNSLKSHALGGTSFFGRFLWGGKLAYSEFDFNDYSYSEFKFSDSYNKGDLFKLKFGYLFGDNLIASIQTEKKEKESAVTKFKAQYQHKLNKIDYLGYTAEIDDELDNYSLSGQYYAKVGAFHYIRLSLGIEDTDRGDLSFGSATFYINAATSIGFSLHEKTANTLTAKHYLTPYWALSATFTDYDEEAEFNNGEEGYKLTLTGQF